MEVLHLALFPTKKIRTNVENLFLREMVEDDNEYIVYGSELENDCMDDLFPEEKPGLFDNTEDEDLEDDDSLLSDEIEYYCGRDEDELFNDALMEED
jgi:hypothetical protein